MSGPDKDIDIRTEMRIALYWRALIGDYKYAEFDPDDMLRWYFALELRGPDEIRELVNERCIARPVKNVVGLVSRAPHPPLWLILAWLELHEQKVRTAAPWALTGAFLVMSLMFFPALHGCADLQPMNPLVLHPPQGSPMVAQYAPVMNSYAAPSQQTGASASTPQTVAPQASVTPTGPTSAGIAGAASGSVSATGTTGGQNGGISAAASH